MKYLSLSLIAALSLASAGYCQTGTMPPDRVFSPTPDSQPIEVPIIKGQNREVSIPRGEGPENALPLDDGQKSISADKKLLSNCGKLILTIKNGRVTSIVDPKTKKQYRFEEIPKKGSGAKY